nr:hypothetical protein [Microbacterium hominis]
MASVGVDSSRASVASYTVDWANGTMPAKGVGGAELRDHRVGKPDGLALEEDDGLFAVSRVDERLDARRQIGRRLVDAEVERRFGQEQRAHRHPRLGGEGCRVQRDHRTRGVPQHRDFSAGVGDDGGQILRLTTR